MPNSEERNQEEDWSSLYDRTRTELMRSGSENFRAEADCWIDDDNIGTRQQKVYVRNLSLLRPEVVTSLQRILQAFPAWEIMIAVSRGVRGESWPDMGLTVRAHEIIDDLQRSYFPPEFRHFRYDGSKPGTDRD